MRWTFLTNSRRHPDLFQKLEGWRGLILDQLLSCFWPLLLQKLMSSKKTTCSGWIHNIFVDICSLLCSSLFFQAIPLSYVSLYGVLPFFSNRAAPLTHLALREQYHLCIPKTELIWKCWGEVWRGVESVCIPTDIFYHRHTCEAYILMFCLRPCVWFADSVLKTSMDSGDCTAVFPEALDCCVWEHY